MKLNTHLELDNDINGKVIELKEDYAKVELITKEFMRADSFGLVHGGFIFCAADRVAMTAVNDPYVVLAKSENKFLAPTKVGDTVILEGNIIKKENNKSVVEVIGYIKNEKVFTSLFYTVTLDKHILNI